MVFERWSQDWKVGIFFFFLNFYEFLLQKIALIIVKSRGIVHCLGAVQSSRFEG